MERGDLRSADAGGAAPAADALQESDRRLLDFERRDWPQPARKEEALHAELGLSAARYYQRLGVLLDSPAALRYDPMLVRRLQRLRDARAAARRRRIPPAAAG